MYKKQYLSLCRGCNELLPDMDWVRVVKVYYYEYATVSLLFLEILFPQSQMATLSYMHNLSANLPKIQKLCCENLSVILQCVYGKIVYVINSLPGELASEDSSAFKIATLFIDIAKFQCGSSISGLQRAEYFVSLTFSFLLRAHVSRGLWVLS